MMTMTIHDLVAEYVVEATAIIRHGENPPIPDLMEQVLAAMRADYPMTATGYSRVRSKLAKESGLGTHGRRAQPVAVKRPAAKRKGLKKRKA